MPITEKGSMLLEDMKEAIDNYDLERLWQLILTDPPGVINKLSNRQLGKRRVERLYAHLKAFDSKTLSARHGFELVLLSCIEDQVHKKNSLF